MKVLKSRCESDTTSESCFAVYSKIGSDYSFRYASSNYYDALLFYHHLDPVVAILAKISCDDLPMGYRIG